MLKKVILFFAFIILIVGVFAGCSKTPTTENQGEKVGNQLTAQTELTYPLTVKDGTGAEVTISAEPKRIISLIPSLTESLFAIGAGEKVVAVTIHDNYPENVQKEVEFIFEDSLNPSMEQIVNLNPDLIVIGPYNEDLTKSLRDLHIPVAKFDPKNIDQVYQAIEILGELTNSRMNAQQLVNKLQEKESEILKKVASVDAKVKVWVEISEDLWTAGQGTFIDELVQKASGINIVEETGWIQYNEEKLLAENPDVIISTYGYYVPNAIEKILARESWQGVPAIKNKQVFNVDSDLVTRPGPRIVDGLEEIAKILYPNLF